jgi:hypothetical protein
VCGCRTTPRGPRITWSTSVSTITQDSTTDRYAAHTHDPPQATLAHQLHPEAHDLVVHGGLGVQPAERARAAHAAAAAAAASRRLACAGSVVRGGPAGRPRRRDGGRGRGCVCVRGVIGGEKGGSGGQAA